MLWLIYYYAGKKKSKNLIYLAVQYFTASLDESQEATVESIFLNACIPIFEMVLLKWASSTRVGMYLFFK